jgi:hypothetical protein
MQPSTRGLALLAARYCAGAPSSSSSSSIAAAAAAAATTTRGFARGAGGPAAAASPAEDRKAANRTALLVKVRVCECGFRHAPNMKRKTLSLPLRTPNSRNPLHPPPTRKQALTPAPPPPPRPASAEDAARAKAYARARMAAHRAWQADLVGKLALKHAAVEALPPGPVRDAAAAPDLTPFPPSRPVWTDSPPIPGFSARQSDALGSQVKETVSKRAAARRGGRVK